MALYQPLVAYPSLDVTVNATSTVQFSIQLRGTQCTKYAIYIYDVGTNSQQYTDTQTLATTLYDGDTLKVDVDMSALGADVYYWKMDLYWDATNYITTFPQTFVASSPASVSFSSSVPSTITTPSYTFIGDYSQAEGVGVKNFTITLYDSTYDGSTNPSDHVVLTSGQVEDAPNNIRYTFNGLISGESYKVQITGTTQGNVEFASVLTSFDVSYIVPTALANPSAVLNPDSSITINIGNIKSITGTTSGTTSYEPNYLYTGNYGLNITAEAYVQFAVDFSPPFTKQWVVTPPIGFTGDLDITRDTDNTYYVSLGYDGTKFYLDLDGDLYYSAPESLTGNPYIVAVIHDGISVRIRHKEVV